MSATQLAPLIAAARAALARLQPETIAPADASRAWAGWDELERIAAAAKTLLARRVDQAGGWKREGYRSAAEAMAAMSGATVAAARATLETSRRLAALPVAEAAVRAGELSARKVEAVAAAASVAPEAEASLVATARSATLRETREACLATRIAVEGDELHAQASRERTCVEFRDELGAWCLHARGPVEAGAEVRATLDELVDEVFRQARRDGAREPRERYAFDALVLMARRARAGNGGEGAPDSTKRSGRKYLGLIRADLEALRRGHVDGDEVCEIAGLGPIPVRVARGLLGDAVLHLVLTAGTEVRNVTHLGRRPTAAQRAALLWESPTCRVEAARRCASRSTTAPRGPPRSARGSTTSTRCAPTTTRSRRAGAGSSPRAQAGAPSSPATIPGTPRIGGPAPAHPADGAGEKATALTIAAKCTILGRRGGGSHGHGRRLRVRHRDRRRVRRGRWGPRSDGG